MRRRSLLYRLFVRNAYYKALSAVLIALLYFWVLADNDREIPLTVEIVMAAPENRVITEKSATEAQVTVGGRWSTLERLISGADEIPPLVLELDPRLGERVVQLSTSMLRTPPDVRVRSINPSSVRVAIEERVRKNVLVRPTVENEPPPGYKAGAPIARPAQVTVSGPRSELEDLREIAAAPIDLTGRTRSFSALVELRPDSPDVRAEQDVPIEVTVPIEIVREERTLSGLSVELINAAQRASIKPKKIDVVVRGNRDALVDEALANVFASIDLSDQRAPQGGVLVLRPTIANLPEGVEIVRTAPTDFRVTLAPTRAGSPPP